MKLIGEDTGLELSVEWRDCKGLATIPDGLIVPADYARLWGRLGVPAANGTGRTIGALNQQPTHIANAMAVSVAAMLLR